MLYFVSKDNPVKAFSTEYICTVHKFSQLKRVRSSGKEQSRVKAGCTLYTVYCTLYVVHCTRYTVNCTLYTVHCTLYFVHGTLYTVHCILSSRVSPWCTFHTLWSFNVHCTLFIRVSTCLCELYTLHYSGHCWAQHFTMYTTVFTVLYTNLCNVHFNMRSTLYIEGTIP